MIAAPAAPLQAAALDRSVAQILEQLQDAARRGDRNALSRLMANPITVQMWAKGRVNTARVASSKIVGILAVDSPLMANFLRAPGRLIYNVLTCKRSGSGWALRVKYQWNLQLDIAGLRGSTRSKVWQVSDLELGNVRGRLGLVRIDFLPADFYRAVGAKLLQMVQQRKFRNQTDLVNAYGKLVNAFLARYSTGPAAGDLKRRDQMGVSGGVKPATNLKDVYYIRSFANPKEYVGVRNGAVVVSTIRSEQERRSFTFRLVRGLAATQGVSFESLAKPGHYLRHCGFRILLHKYENVAIYKKDATFVLRAGLANSAWRSFQSVNFPKMYIIRAGAALHIGGVGNAADNRNATFSLVPAQGSVATGSSGSTGTAPAATYSAQITGVSFPTQVTAGQTVRGRVSYACSFPGLVTVDIRVEHSPKMSVAGRRLRINGRRSGVIDFTFRAPTKPQTMKLQASARYWRQVPKSRRWLCQQSAGAIRPFQVEVVASSGASTTGTGWKTARVGPATNARPTGVINFNNRKWTNLTSVFSRGREFWLMTDNRVKGTATLTLWLAFPSAQSFDLLTYRHPTAEIEKRNYSRFAKYRAQAMARGSLSSSCQRQLSADGVPRGSWSALAGRIVCRVEIQAYDWGEFAAYVLTTSSPASKAYGLAKIVSSDRVVSRARAGLFTKPAASTSTTTSTTTGGSAAAQTAIRAAIDRHAQGMRRENVAAAMSPFQPGIVWEGVNHYYKTQCDLEQVFADLSGIGYSIRNLKFEPHELGIKTTFDYTLSGYSKRSKRQRSVGIKAVWLWRKTGDTWKVIDSVTTLLKK